MDALARAMIAAGVGKGDRVAMLAPPSPDFLTVFLATAAVGAIWVGLNPRYRYEELAYVVSDCAPRLIVGRPPQGPLKLLAHRLQVRPQRVGHNTQFGN